MRAFLILFFALSAATAQASDLPEWQSKLSVTHPLTGRIWDVRQSKFTEPVEMIRQAVAADFLLLGEKHDNPDHHRLQDWVLRKVVAGGVKPAVAFEMIAETKQPILETFQNHRETDLELLAAQLNWDKSGWPAWKYYAPIFQTAISNDLPLIGANLKHRAKLTPARMKRLQIDGPLPGELADRLLDTVDAGHCRLVPKSALAPMVAVQRKRDAVLAENLMKFDRPAVLIAGANHARADFGVPFVLSRLAPEKTAVSVAFLEVSDDGTSPADYNKSFAGVLPFDFVWFTPRFSDKDYCLDLKEKFKSHKK